MRNENGTVRLPFGAVMIQSYHGCPQPAVSYISIAHWRYCYRNWKELTSYSDRFCEVIVFDKPKIYALVGGAPRNVHMLSLIEKDG